MAPKTLNILLTSFPGLGLPPTLSLPIPADTTVSEFQSILTTRLPQESTRYILTTNSNKDLSSRPSTQLSSLLSCPEDVFLPLRLSVPLCGGKGGFGSQLRAAGGRMSSRKKRNQGENNGSNRNLDGRRLRTVAEAKALAEYLAIKPEMEKKEKAERRKRWQEIVDSTERKQEELKNGEGRARLDAQWVEAKEEASEKTREAVLKAYNEGLGKKESDSSGSASEEADGSESDSEMVVDAPKQVEKQQPAARTFFGWDEDDDMSDSEEDEDVEDVPDVAGKGKATA